MDFSQWLQQEMDKRQLTKYRLSKLSGVHQTTISNLLDGAKPQMETEKKIRAAILNDGEQKEKPHTENGVELSERRKEAHKMLDEMSEEELAAAWPYIKKMFGK